MKTLRLLFLSLFAIAACCSVAFAIPLVYDGGGPQASIQQAMAELGFAFDLRGPGNPVTATDLATHEVLVVGWNYQGDMSGLSQSVLAFGITGNVLLTGHDADTHTVHGCDFGPGGDACDAAASTFLNQAILWASSGPGAGMVALSDYSGLFSYLPASWAVTAATVDGDNGEPITSITPAGAGTGVYAGLTTADLSNWHQSFHTRFLSRGFADFEFGGPSQSDIVTVGGRAPQQVGGRVVQTGCEPLTIGGAPFVRVTFGVINLGTTPICSVHLTPVQSGPTPSDSCKIFECSNPPGWQCATDAAGGASWVSASGEACILHGQKVEPFDIVLDPLFCCYQLALDGPDGAIFFRDAICFECQKPVPTRKATWGSVKGMYR